MPQGNFVALSLLVAEVEVRLAECGTDGAMAELYYTYSKPEDRVAKAFGYNVTAIGRRIDRACLYMSGKNRRRVSYREFIQHKKKQTK